MPVMVGTEESVEQLVAKSKAGCLHSFETLVRIHEKALFNYLAQILGSAHDAEDAAQETFVKAFRGLARYREDHHFSSWLFAIGRNTAISHYRKRRRHDALEEWDGLEAVETERSEEAENIWVAARTLEPKHYEVLYLHYGEGLAVKEMAHVMGTNVVYIKVLLHRARAALKRKVKRTS